MTDATKRKIAALALDLSYVALLFAGETRYAKTADLALVALSLGWIALLSIHRLRDWWLGRGLYGSAFYRKYWRWLTGDDTECR